MEVAIRKMGNSQGVLIPKPILAWKVRSIFRCVTA